MNSKHSIVIVGGGFAGLYTAMELEKTFPAGSDVTITLVNRENFFLFTPMLHEVAAGDLDITNIVNPVRKLLKKVMFYEGEVRQIDLDARRVVVSHGLRSHSHELQYDQLVLALGSTTQYFGLPGVEENALTMKSLADAVQLRNRLIALLEAADTERSADERARLLSVVAAGAGFAGVETLASINDFLRKALRFYPNLTEDEVSMTLVHPGKAILTELGPELGKYAEQKLERRGIKVLGDVRVASYDGETVVLNDGRALPARTLLWTAGTMPHPLLATLPCEKEHGRLKVNAALEVPGYPGVWALGDCACVPDLTTGGLCPPTAQHGLRQGKVAARNIRGYTRGEAPKPFRFKTIGQLATIGHRAGVARVFGVNVSGFIAWWMWRTIYLSKLPRLEKKVRVALDWTLDVLFSKDLCQFVDVRDGQKMDNDSLDELHGRPANATVIVEG